MLTDNVYLFINKASLIRTTWTYLGSSGNRFLPGSLVPLCARNMSHLLGNPSLASWVFWKCPLVCPVCLHSTGPLWGVISKVNLGAPSRLCLRWRSLMFLQGNASDRICHPVRSRLMQPAVPMCQDKNNTSSFNIYLHKTSFYNIPLKFRVFLSNIPRKYNFALPRIWRVSY